MSVFGTDGPAELVKSAGLLLAASFTGDLEREEVRQAIQLATGSLSQIAVAARSEGARQEMSQGKQGDDLIFAIHELIRWLCVNLPSAELLAQCVRAVGNLVVDHDVNRGRALSYGLVQQIIAAVFDCSCSTSGSFFFPNSIPPSSEARLPSISDHPVSCIRFACGAITNLCHTNTQLLSAVLEHDGALAMVMALNSTLAAQQFDPTTATFAIRAMCMFADLPQSQALLFSAGAGPAAIRVGMHAVSEGHDSIAAQVCVLLGLLDVKLNLSVLGEAGAVSFLVRCVSYESDEDAVAIAALQALCPLIQLAPSEVISVLTKLLPPPHTPADAVSELQQLSLDALVRLAPTPYSVQGVTKDNLQAIVRITGSDIDMFRKNSLTILEAIAQTEEVARMILHFTYKSLSGYAAQFSVDDQTATLALGVLRRISIYHSLRRELVERNIVNVLLNVCATPVSEERNIGMFYCVRILYNLLSCADDISLRSIVAASLPSLDPLLNPLNSSKPALQLDTGRVLAHLALEPVSRQLMLSTRAPATIQKIISVFAQMSLTPHYILHAEVCRALDALIPEVCYCDNLKCFAYSGTCKCSPASCYSLASLLELQVTGLTDVPSVSQEPSLSVGTPPCLSCKEALKTTLDKLLGSSEQASNEQLMSQEELRSTVRTVLARIDRL